MNSLLTAAACVCVIALNLLATSKVIRDTTVPEGRRVATLAAIWILPLVMAVVVLLMPAGTSAPKA